MDRNNNGRVAQDLVLMDMAAEEPINDDDEPRRPYPAANMVTMSQVLPEAIQWLWRDRIPLGGLTLLDGDPGTGKTTILLDVAARLTTGASMPDDSSSASPADVVILTVEDHLAATIRPRLEAAGADLDRVHAITGIPDVQGERPVVMPDDWAYVINAALIMKARFLFLDPLMALLGGNVDSYRDQDVRRALVPGIKAAQKHGFSLAAIRHLTKGEGGNPLYRGGGSIGVIAAARSAMLAGQDPNDETGDRRVLAMSKHNLAERAQSLAYTIEPVALTDGIETTRIHWEGGCDISAAELLAVRKPSSERLTAVDQAADFLEAELQGGPRPVREIEQAATHAGISKRTLDRAR